MMKSNKINRSLMTQALRRKIAEYLTAHLDAHLPSGRPTRITLREAPVSASTHRRAGEFVATAVLPVYVVKLNQLARARWADLRPTGFILLVFTPSKQKLLVEVDDRKQLPPSIRVVSGESVDSLERALNSVAASSKQKQRSLRILRSPSLHLSAVWSYSTASGQTSCCVPITANFAGVKVGRRYTLRRFQQILQAAALQNILRWYERTTFQKNGS